MDKFFASNGVVVVSLSGMTRTEDSLGATLSALSEQSVEALREFFAHKHDVELGRWRWPENPDYVVYPPRPGVYGRGRGVQVLNEKAGRFADCWETPGVNSPADAGAYAAARAYFAAHPEPKPWHDAKPGEVWVITTENVANEVAVQRTPDGGWQYNDGRVFADHGIEIATARRIFPEVSDD